MANWCTVIFLGQIMTRMNLTWSANPHVRGTTPKWTTCGILGITVVVLIVTLYSIDIAIFPYPYPDVNTGVVSSDPGVKFWYLVKQCITLTWICFTFVIMCKTRAHIRRTYGIPETTCRGCEDCCCSFFCGCCTVAQMARHTTDYRTYKAACCNRTGMADSTPPTCPHLV